MGSIIKKVENTCMNVAVHVYTLYYVTATFLFLFINIMINMNVYKHVWYTQLSIHHAHSHIEVSYTVYHTHAVKLSILQPEYYFSCIVTGNSPVSLDIPAQANPSCLQTTALSRLSKESSQTVPHTFSWQTSTRPSYWFLPSTSRTSPSLQL